ncbi:anaerobic sulfite reductase subunit AsrA [Garciella nitratireducens]|uniref:Anaerobic sulfite reductase subunit A n=1 Tax=Garciella nitratireducens DSM 15102 TaxID=1121911 RepID=A0A1T4MVU5_9FIRM|nr:anaerobic sulfite reductase subunit AsrA [Garciella nitratireducens]RBP44930.1 anaerobic sulfite reductase subunit A [Garciella nitratireducens]SJZ71031.1 anaerobic sulfite reductase subunit A [Garciella nitratireducens DSM 15102]
MATSKTYLLEKEEINELFTNLEKQYVLYAPVKISAGGRYQEQDSIMYKPIHTYQDIEFNERSTYSAKEVLTPITQTLFYFTDDEFTEAKLKQKKNIIIFARSCDINAIKIQDQIYLENGNIEDFFYKRVRNKVKFALMECSKEFDGCFCCSVGSNKTDHYSIAFSFEKEKAHIEVKDETFDHYFNSKKTSHYQISFPTENKLKVNFPVIENIDLANQLKKHPMWDEFENRCIACGACTIACSTCSCFETTDIVYTENPHIGERRRTYSSCMINGFDEMAGGNCFRKKNSEKYRYKILHKVYGHNARFQTGPMCVGCGRCSARCPQLISYPETLKKLCHAIKEIKQKKGV